MTDQSNNLMLRVIRRLAGWSEVANCPVIRLGDAAVEPDQLAAACYVEVSRKEQHGNREVCSLQFHLRTSARQDPAQARMDGLQQTLEKALDAVLDGVGVVPGAVSGTIADDFHVRTLSFEIYIINPLQEV